MGIHSWFTAALIALFLFASSASAATVRPVNVPPVGAVLGNTSYSFQTPNGDAGYFGREFVDRHTAGNRFTGGPGSLNFNGPDGTVSLKLRPVVTAKPATVASRAGSILRSSPAQIAASLAVGVMLDAIDGVIRDNQVMVPGVLTLPEPDASNVHTVVTVAPQGYPRRNDVSSHKFPDPITACADVEQWARENSGLNRPLTAGLLANNRFDCRDSTRTEWGAGRTYGTSCPPDYGYDANLRSCVKPDWVPATSGDYSTMENVAKGFNPDYLRDLITASCEGSGSPSACYEQLLDRAPLDGPSTQSPPTSTTSTTTTNPDGTTTTTSTSTSNNYSYTYSPTSYTYTTTTTTTTTGPNGETTTETVTDAQPEGEEPSREEEADPTYTDTDFPEVEPFYEQQYPDGIEGIWEARKAELDQSEFVAFLQSFVPSFSGSCPSFSLNLNVMTGSNFGIHNFPSLCYVFDFIKVILLVTAVFTARALIFGG